MTSHSHTRRSEPELETITLARMTRKSIERLAPFCQMRLPPNSVHHPLVSKTNGKILRLIQAIDTSMLVGQIGYRLASDAAALCDPFDNRVNTTTPEMLQTMAAHGCGHAQRTSESFRDIQQDIYKIAAVTKDDDTDILVPPDPQQPSALRITLKEAGSSLVANLNLLNQFSRSMLDMTTWWEWLEEELMSPDSTLLPSASKKDATLFARWNNIKAGYLDYYNIVSGMYMRYPQLLTTSNAAWQSISSLPPAQSPPLSVNGSNHGQPGNIEGPEPQSLPPRNTAESPLHARKEKNPRGLGKFIAKMKLKVLKGKTDSEKNIRKDPKEDKEQRKTKGKQAVKDKSKSREAKDKGDEKDMEKEKEKKEKKRPGEAGRGENAKEVAEEFTNTSKPSRQTSISRSNRESNYHEGRLEEVGYSKPEPSRDTSQDGSVHDSRVTSLSSVSTAQSRTEEKKKDSKSSASVFRINLGCLKCRGSFDE